MVSLEFGKPVKLLRHMQSSDNICNEAPVVEPSALASATDTFSYAST